MKTIRWGIVGAGGIAARFAADLAYVPDAELVAIASRSAEKAAAFARRFGLPRAYGHYDALFHDADLDAVYVATPHTCHARDAAAALRAGKAVLCEKPLTTTPAAARALFDVAERAGGYLMEAMWTYFLPAIRQAEAWVRDGRIGRLCHVRADFGFALPYDPGSRAYNPALGGGALLDVGIYPVALAWLLLRQHPESVRVSRHLAPNGVDRDVTALLHYPDATAALAASFRCQLPNTAWLIGETGRIEIPDFWAARQCTRYEGDTPVERFEDGRAGEGFCFEARAVGDDLRAGRQQSARVSWQDSLAFQEHMARIRAQF